MPKHSASLLQKNYIFYSNGGMGLVRPTGFQKPRLLRSQKVFTLREAPVFAGQKIFLHRPTCVEDELDNIDYNQPATVIGVEKDDDDDDESKVRTLCGTLDKCFREVTFQLRMDDSNLLTNRLTGENETVFPFSIDQSSKVAFAYKPNDTFDNLCKNELIKDIWQFWKKLRNRIYKDVQDDEERLYKGHHYRPEAMAQFRKLLDATKYRLDSYFLELTKTFHQAEPQPSRSDLQSNS